MTVPVITGQVIHGEKVGRQLGFPTANLAVTLDESQVKPGVYLAEVTIENLPKKYKGLAYFGPRYIFGELTNSFEVFIYDFEEDLYHTQLSVRLTHFIRPPLELNTLEKLKLQLEKDKQAGLALLGQ